MTESEKARIVRDLSAGVLRTKASIVSVKRSDLAAVLGVDLGAPEPPDVDAVLAENEQLKKELEKLKTHEPAKPKRKDADVS